jgi:fluoride exporter
MDGLRTLLLVSAAGAVGTAARYLVSRTFSQVPFPAGTLIVNILGSFIIGLVLPMALKNAWPESLRLVVTTGLLGGFTTYSAFNYELTAFLSEGHWVKAGAYAVGTVAGAIVAGFAGLALSK